jgi:SNF2 family DNA or RNA helicase
VTLTLRPYQIEGCYFLAERRFALLADEMRVGKTPQAIMAAHKVGALRVAVVCPAIAVSQWREEFKRWGLASIASGRHVMSYDRARATDWSTLPRFDVAIVDECHFAKNPGAQRTKAIFGKGGLGHHADRVWCLSGTPVTKHAGEFWPMLVAFGYTSLSYESFCRYFCDYDWTGTNIKGTKQSKIPELRAILAKFMLRRTRRQVAPEMDDIDFQFLAVEPVSRVDLHAPRGTATSDTEIEQWIDCGSVGLDDISRKEVAVAKALPLVEEIAACLERGDYKQTVVFAWHRDAIDAVTLGLSARGIAAYALHGGQAESTRTFTQRIFKEGRLPVVVAQIVAAGTAIDLSAASHGYFLELDWLPANNIQAANRLVSLQKDEPVTFDVCTWPGSVDDKVQRILLRRTQETRTILQ